MYNYSTYGIVGFSRAEGDWFWRVLIVRGIHSYSCLLYTSDAADDTPCVDLGGRRIIKKKN